MLAAIMQPTYLPWIGYFDLIDQADRFVFLDDAQVLKRSWGVRNRVLTEKGPAFLSVPLSGHKHGEGSPFCSTLVNMESDWQRSHLGTIRHNYAKAPHFEAVFAHVEGMLTAGHETIGALNEAFIAETARKVGIDTPLSKSSEMEGLEGRKEVRLISICDSVGAGTYLSARGSADYIEADGEGGAFNGSSTKLLYHHYEHPTYPQGGDEFVSHMSIVDLLMHTGFEGALEVIRAGRRPSQTSAEVRAEMGA